MDDPIGLGGDVGDAADVAGNTGALWAGRSDERVGPLLLPRRCDPASRSPPEEEAGRLTDVAEAIGAPRGERGIASYVGEAVAVVGTLTR
jgi:hypothetical protein